MSIVPFKHKLITSAAALYVKSSGGGSTVAIDATSTAFNVGGTSNNNFIQWTHTPVGTPSGVAVAFHYYGFAITGVTYGGAAMTQYQTITNPGPGSTYGQLWGLANPSSGAQTVSINLNVALMNYNFWAAAVTVTGGSTSTVFRNTSGYTGTAGGSVSGSVTSAVGDLVIDMCGDGDTSDTVSPGSGQTLLISNVGSSSALNMSYRSGSAATTNMSYNAVFSSECEYLIGSFEHA